MPSRRGRLPGPVFGSGEGGWPGCVPPAGPRPRGAARHGAAGRILGSVSLLAGPASLHAAPGILGLPLCGVSTVRFVPTGCPSSQGVLPPRMSPRRCRAPPGCLPACGAEAAGSGPWQDAVFSSSREREAVASPLADQETPPSCPVLPLGAGTGGWAHPQPAHPAPHPGWGWRGSLWGICAPAPFRCPVFLVILVLPLAQAGGFGTVCW